MDEIAWENNTTVQTFEYSTEEIDATSTLEKHDNVAYYSFVMIPVILCFALGINLIYRCFHQDVRNVIQDV
jgi:hypothetical protein